MAIVKHIKHKNSDVANKAPNAEVISNGEIAVNYADDTERMYIKNASGKIIPFSADHIIIDSVLNTVLMDRTMGKGYDVDNPNLANVYGSKEALNMVLKHYKMGLFKDGALVKECAPCRITKAVDGSDINIDGSEGDIMLYTDVPIYRDRCRVSGVTVPNSSATTHNMIGLGLMPHQIGWKDAKKMNPFAFTPGYVQLDTTTTTNQYRSCYNTSFSGSGSAPYNSYFTTNFILKNGALGGYPVMEQSAFDNMKYSRNKGPKYQGIFYEFYEMWLIAMYLELGSLNFTDIDSFGKGCTCPFRPDASNWISGGLSGVLIKDGNGEGTDVYSTFMVYMYGLLGGYPNNFEEALESQRFVDALVKSNLVDKVDGKTVLEYDDNKKGYVKVSENVDLASGSGMTYGKKYYIIRNVPNCQGIGDGVMTYVLNVFVKTKFKDDYSDTNYRGKDIIFKFSYPTYRGLELFSGGQTQIEGINYVLGNDGDGSSNNAYKGSIWYAKDYTDIKYDPTNYKPTDDEVPIGEDIPYIKGFVKAGEYEASKNADGWVKTANYDVSLYCITECGGRANESSYECGYVTRTYFYISPGHKRVNTSVVGCNANTVLPGRTLNASSYITARTEYYAGGFSIGNPSL